MENKYQHDLHLQIIDKCSIEDNNMLFTVSLEPGFIVAVKVCSENGLTYVMQNEDGSTVYSGSCADITYPNYKYNEADVVAFVKSVHVKESEQASPSVQDILRHADSLMEYADSGLIENVADLSSLFTISAGSIYRGLYLPKEWLKPGFVLEEWTGSTHWSKLASVAKRFSTSMDGEDFMYEYGESKGLYKLSEILPLFKPIILVMDQPVRSIDLGAYLDILEENGYDIGSVFLSGMNDEFEVSVVGYDFKIDHVEDKDGQCFVHVTALDRFFEREVCKPSLDDQIKSASIRSDVPKHSFEIKEAEL